MDEWNVREELLEAAHRWPVVFLIFLVGSALGWAAGWVYPTPYRAEAELFVAYNGDATFRNPDDYKNWQLGELEAYITSDDVLRATLDRLAEQDSYWEGWSIQQLRPNLTTYWRNAGKWRLVGQASQPQHAEQMATAWRESVLRKASLAIQHGRDVLNLSDRNHLLLVRQFDTTQNTLALASTQDALNAWLASASQQDSQQPLPPMERWRLLSLVAGSAQLNPLGASLLEQAPPESAPRQEYTPWVERAAASAQSQVSSLQAQLQDLQTQQQDITQQWEAASAASHNLTVYLTLEPITESSVRGLPVRQNSTLALVGGLLAAILWGFWWLSRPRRRRAA